MEERRYSGVVASVRYGNAEFDDSTSQYSSDDVGRKGMKLGGTLFVSLLIMGTMLIGCARDATPTQPTAPVATPRVSITSPASGASLPEGTVGVSISVNDFTIVSKLGQPNAAGEGHIHYYLDAQPPTTPGQPAVSAPGTYAATPELSHMWQDVAPGSHTLAVQLVNNNHTPLEPPVVAQVTVNVTASPMASPAVTITSPSQGATLPEGSVTVSINVAGFDIVTKLGQPNAAGEGHIHYYLDAEPPTTPGQPAVSAPGTYAATPELSHTWQDVAPGSHTLAVQLVNNNHTPLEPPVVAQVSINVSSAPPPAVTIQLSAQSGSFNTSTITVPAGAAVTMEFNNMESDYHNFALYQSAAATSSIFVGEVIIGPRTITYEFMAPETPGSYFFRCDVHPATMTGSFIVT